MKFIFLQFAAQKICTWEIRQKLLLMSLETSDNKAIHTGPIPRFSNARFNSCQTFFSADFTNSGLLSSSCLSWSCTGASVRLNVPLQWVTHNYTLIVVYISEFNVPKRGTFVIKPLSRHCHLRGAEVHGVHQTASHIPALYLPSRSQYSLTDPERMEGGRLSKPRPRVQRATGPQLPRDRPWPAGLEPTTSRSLVEHANH